MGSGMQWTTASTAAKTGTVWVSVPAISNLVTLLKLSFAHKGVDEPSGYFGFESTVESEIEEPEINEPSDDLPITADFSDGYSVNDDNEMSEESSESSVQPKDLPEEELIEFSLNSDALQELSLLLNPAMLMYIVSLEFISFVVCRESFTELGNVVEY